MENGTIKWFNPKKGFGFIANDSGNDVFVHHSQVEEKAILTQGDQVLYETVQGEMGPKATHVTKNNS
ncbi:MAG: cold shock domain-containing protein [Phycisphaerae bacterium]|nr:cold shock domain-containing protein [Phycisphaerae bacterium]